MKRFMSIDAETNGLWGEPFAIGAILYSSEGKTIESFDAALDPKKYVTDPWVKENVVPEIPAFLITHESYEEMMNDFGKWYMENKEDTDVIWHMGHIVESFLFRELHRLEYIGDFDAPYCPIEVSDLLREHGEEPDSVDRYAYKNRLVNTDYGNTHNPLYDAIVTARVYMHIKGIR